MGCKTHVMDLIMHRIWYY